MSQNLVPFVLNNSIWLMLVALLCALKCFWIFSDEYTCMHCHASFYIPFGTTSYIHSQYEILARFLLYTFYIGVIYQSYLCQISFSSFPELVLEHYKLKPQCILLNYFSLATSVCCSCPCLLFV